MKEELLDNLGGEDVSFLIDTPSDRLHELKQMFSMTEAASEAERRCDAHISEIIQGFLSRNAINTNISLRLLAEKFRNSRIPEAGTAFDSYLNYLDSNVVFHSTNTSLPRFIGHMSPALPFFVRPLGKLMMALNQNLVKVETAKAASPFERQVLAMIHRLVYDLPDAFYDQHIQNREQTLGIVTSGGTLANVTALWCARNFALGPKNDFAGIENEGLPAALRFFGYSNAVIIGSHLMHYSFEKAAGVLGIGTRGVIRVPVDHKNRIVISRLKETITECRAQKKLIIALVGIAGSTETGSVDFLEEMAAIAKENNIHFHVDAAWGGPVLFSRKYRSKLTGIERADSVTIDGHKQMYLPMGIGMVLLRDPQLAGVIEKQAQYILRAGSMDLGRRALEGSRPGMSLFVHAALTILGREGYERLIDDSIRKTSYMAKAICAQPEFELLAEPEMNILVYRFIPPNLRVKTHHGKLTSADNESINETNQKLQRFQRQLGNSFVSRTALTSTVYGHEIPIVALRVVVANPLTTNADIDAVLSEQLDLANRIC